MYWYETKSSKVIVLGVLVSQLPFIFQRKNDKTVPPISFYTVCFMTGLCGGVCCLLQQGLVVIVVVG